MAKNNKDFYATRSTAWWKVAIAMIGSCLSGVTFVSVPGMVDVAGFGYLQMVMIRSTYAQIECRHWPSVHMVNP